MSLINLKTCGCSTLPIPVRSYDTQFQQLP